MHNNAVREEIERQLASIDGGIAQAFEHSWEVEEKAVCAAISCVYFLAKEEIPHMTKYQPLLELIQHLGMPYLETLHKSGNVTSTSHRTVDEFLSIACEVVKLDIVRKIQTSPRFSIICDETTDISTTKQLIVYIKAITDNANIETFFLALKELPDADANSITLKLQETLEENGLELSHCCGLGSDGASVMTGIHTGVSAQLKSLQPTLVSVHCVAHRLALAVMQAATKVDAVDKFKKQINALFVVFHCSAKRQGTLQAAFSFMESASLKLQRPSDTRWLACDAAIQVVKRSLEPLLFTLNQIADEGEATALGLATLLTKYKFVAAVFFMSEILPVLSRLSKTFQIENLSFGSIKPALDRANRSIELLYTCSQSSLAEWQKELLEWEQKSGMILNDCNESQFLSSFVIPFIKAIQMNLKNRFPDHDISILSVAEVFNPTEIPSIEQDMYAYGRSSITTLATHYKCNLSETISEWKEVVSTAKEKFSNISEFLHFLVSMRDIYPQLGIIASSLLVIPMHSADCERGFSALGRIRTKIRSRLTNKSLNSLLTISVEGPDIKDFNVQECLRKWRGIRKRRIFSGQMQSYSSSIGTQT
jgi:uncharacterized protein YsxB (DUF464 family)